MNRAQKNPESGQAAVEYLLVVVILVAVMYAFGNVLKPGLNNIMTSVFGEMDSKITTKLGKLNEP